MNPILLISDTHYHNFTAYSQLRADGVNTRLGDIIRATAEAAMALKKAGGKTIIHCGDAFHLRGAVSPTVLNPVMELYRKLVQQGFEIHMIAGNHDLETEDSNWTANTSSALKSVGVNVYSKYEQVTIEGQWWHFVPWIKDLKSLRNVIWHINHGIESGPHNLVLHAPINGVIKGLPDHGLSSLDFRGNKFNRVFAGHFHNHANFEFDGSGGTKGTITSVGALTHQSWSDVDNLAGYVLYDPRTNELDHYETNAPQFIKVEFDDLDKLHDATFADNYVKVVGGTFTDPEDIATVKEELILRGAKAVTVEGLTRKPVATRAGVTASEAPTLDGILSDYIDRTYPGDIDTKVLALGYLKDSAND